MDPPNAKILNQTLDKFPSWSFQFKNSAFHQGSHGKYTLRIKGRIDEIQELFLMKKINSSEAIDEMILLTQEVRKSISNGIGKSINEINF